jgi:DNA invertase Pin-like site-specific DNA recombinase
MVKIAARPVASTAYSYIRFSSPQQAEGDSLRRQTERAEAYCRRRGWALSGATYRDLGVSAFKGDNALVGNLGEFLKAVKSGAVVPGSALVVESIDRISRQGIDEGYDLIKSILKAGVVLVTLSPEREFDASATKSLSRGALEIQLILERAAEESERKADRCGAAWGRKKQEARAMNKPYGRMCPAWLELVDGKYRTKAGAARTVRRIFQWCAEGVGTFGILAKLNAEGVPPIGRTGRWERSYVRKILTSPAVMGVYQPHKGSRGPSRIPEGDPVPGYYPAVIDERLWYAAQAAMKARARKSGRPAMGSGNPFSGLLWSATDRTKLHVCGTRGYKYLVSAAAIQKRPGAKWSTFPLDPFVSAVRSQLEELKASDLFTDPGAARLAELDGRLAEVDKKLAKARERFDADPDSPTWADMVDKYDRERRALVAEQSEAQRAAATPLSASWAAAVELMARDEPERLRAALLSVVDSVWCVFATAPNGRDRAAWVQVWFKGDGRQRVYAVYYRPGSATPKARVKARWSARSLPYDKAGKIDLRDRKQATRAAKELAEELDGIGSEAGT